MQVSQAGARIRARRHRRHLQQVGLPRPRVAPHPLVCRRRALHGAQRQRGHHGRRLLRPRGVPPVVPRRFRAVERRGAVRPQLLRYIVNVYAVLLTRGIRGTYVYVVDEALREHLRAVFATP
ncbi:DUF2075 domain-containing protein [Protaetiibacter intestinalis]|uniref:DUF2075 domain-containing protein n=1 Tax=Protaetiibacter intestinalis TaxID=2419774 RepID=A0A387B5D2_9MICO|nr:DUF2075 domain-containing protein [Protaetiibacter intestinalis]